MKTESKIYILLGILFLFTIITGIFQEYFVPQSTTILINGTGTVFKAPDMTTVNASVELFDEDPQALQGKVEEKMNKIKALLLQHGVASEDIKTNAYNVNIQYDWNTQPRQIVNYSASHSLEIGVRNLSKLPEILSTLVKEGATSVNQYGFSLQDPQSAQLEATKDALKKIQDQAESLAQASGKKLGKMIRIQNQATPEIGFPMSYRGMGGGGGSESSPNLNPGMITINSQVSAEFLLE